MEKNLGKIIDLEKYPIHDLQSHKIKKIIEKCKAELENYSWPGNVRELRNVIERASVLFNAKSVAGNNVKENLLRLKVPDPDEEQDELWAASTDLVEVDDKKEDDEQPLKNTYYKDGVEINDIYHPRLPAVELQKARDQLGGWPSGWSIHEIVEYVNKVRHPASTIGWLATTPTLCPSSRIKPVIIFFANSPCIS